MFEETIRSLQQLNGMTVSVPSGIEKDADGYIDRECPATECKFGFKVHADDWRDIVSDEAVHCVFCGHTAASREWLTQDQVEYVRNHALAQVKGLIGQALRDDAQRWNRSRSGSGFLRITLNVSSRPTEVVLPAEATNPMRIQIKCSACGCRYAVIGSAFFCPACGHNDADHVFRQSMSALLATLDAIPFVRQGITDPDVAENTVRLMIESGLQNAVTAFQRLAEALYLRRPTAGKPRRNVFQNLTEGSVVWGTTFGSGYEVYLSTSELVRLNLLFQQRHLLAHREGLVDDDYVAKSGDITYRPGQRIVIREANVRECIQLIETLAAGLERDADSELGQ